MIRSVLPMMNVPNQVRSRYLVFCQFFLLPPVLCISNDDCREARNSPVCKQYTKGGARSCRPSRACPKSCEADEFCTAGHACKVGLMDVCGTNQDCAHLHVVNNTCLDMGSHKICIPQIECREKCSKVQLCHESRRSCESPGKT